MFNKFSSSQHGVAWPSRPTPMSARSRIICLAAVLLLFFSYSTNAIRVRRSTKESRALRRKARQLESSHNNNSTPAPPRATNLTAVPYDECLILNKLDGIDTKECDCPPGFVLCTRREVANRMAARRNMWPFAKDLCDRGLYSRGSLIYVDFNHYLRCALESTPRRTVLEFHDDDFGDAAVLPKGYPVCSLSEHFLCKRVFGSDSRDCHMSDWADWTVCNERGVRRRRRDILSSGQHAGRVCVWNEAKLDENRVIEVEVCSPYQQSKDKKTKK